MNALFEYFDRTLFPQVVLRYLFPLLLYKNQEWNHCPNEKFFSDINFLLCYICYTFFSGETSAFIG